MKLGLLGINHRVASLPLREKIARACDKHLGMGSASSHSILLSTCNRTEIYFGGDLAESQSELLRRLRLDIDADFEQRMYTFFGVDAFHHLARVTAGLDSAVIFESDIQGQVKRAYQSGFDLSSELHFAFQKALHVGKEVRQRWPIAPGTPDIEEAIVDEGKGLIGQLKGKRALLIGASDINRKVLRKLKSKGVDISLCNRTLERGEAFAREEGVEAVDWEERHRWNTYHLTVCATKAPHHLITKGEGRDRLVVDLSVPRNVSPTISAHLRNVHQLHAHVRKRRHLHKQILSDAEELVSSHIARYTERMTLAYSA